MNSPTLGASDLHEGPHVELGLRRPPATLSIVARDAMSVIGRRGRNPESRFVLRCGHSPNAL